MSEKLSTVIVVFEQGFMSGPTLRGVFTDRQAALELAKDRNRWMEEVLVNEVLDRFRCLS